MTCKDCLHCDGCCNFVPIEGTVEEKAEYLYECLKKPCKDFKNKADYIKVVRCRDCRYFDKGFVNNNGFFVCSASGMEITENDFCSYGERRKDDDV